MRRVDSVVVTAAVCAGFLLGGCAGAPGDATGQAAAGPVNSAAVSATAAGVPGAAASAPGASKGVSGSAATDPAAAAPLTSGTAVHKAAKSKTLKRPVRKARGRALTKTKARTSTTANHSTGIFVDEMRRAADSEG